MYIQMLALKIDTGYKKLEFKDSFIIFTFFAIIYLVFQGESKNTETKIKSITIYHPTAL